MINAKARYEPVRDAGPDGRADRAAMNTAGLQAAINAVAAQVVAEAQGMIASTTPTDASHQRALGRYYKSLHVVDGGKDFPRAKYLRGSSIRVALISVLGGTGSAKNIEFGNGRRPGIFALSRAVQRLRMRFGHGG